MSYVAERAAIESWFQDRWTKTPVAWENVAFDPTTVNEWVRLTVIRAGGFHAGMGSETMLNRYPGVVVVQVFVLPGSGTNRALELADDVTNLWRGAQFNGLSFSVPGIDMQDVNDGWYQVNVSCEFHRDSCEMRAI